MLCVLKMALTIIREFCLKQNKCSDCLLNGKCGKLPSEW